MEDESGGELAQKFNPVFARGRENQVQVIFFHPAIKLHRIIGKWEEGKRQSQTEQREREREAKGKGTETEMNWFHSRVGSLRGMVSVTTQRGHDDLHPASVADPDLLPEQPPIPSRRVYYDATVHCFIFYLLIKNISIIEFSLKSNIR